MAHFPGPHSWTVRGVFRTLATVVFTLCFGTFCEENVRHFVEERHWNEFLSNGLQSMPDLGPITQSHWFWFVFGASTGIVSALWMAMFFSDSSNLSGRGSATTLVSYAHGLALVQVQPSLDLRNPGNTLELRLIIRNASGLPIKFVIEKYDVIIEGQIVKCNLNGAVIARDGIMTISPGHGFTKTQYSSFKSRFRGTIEYILVYGDPDGHLSRRSYKLVSIDFFKKGAALNNNWVIVNESEEPA